MPVLVNLPEELRTEILVHAREVFPEEACGFLLGSRQEGPGQGCGTRFECHAQRQARNLHPRREDRFLIDPLEYAKAERYCARHPERRLALLGFWHSHPASPPRPSSEDLDQARGLYRSFPLRYLYLIVSLDRSDPDWACWRLDPGGTVFEALSLRQVRGEEGG